MRSLPEITFLNKKKRLNPRLRKTNARAKGTNPRAVGTNPRARKQMQCTYGQF
jgi:hypothetical protein